MRASVLVLLQSFLPCPHPHAGASGLAVLLGLGSHGRQWFLLLLFPLECGLQPVQSGLPILLLLLPVTVWLVVSVCSPRLVPGGGSPGQGCSCARALSHLGRVPSGLGWPASGPAVSGHMCVVCSAEGTVCPVLLWPGLASLPTSALGGRPVAACTSGPCDGSCVHRPASGQRRRQKPADQRCSLVL